MSFVLKDYENQTEVDNVFSFHNGFTGEHYVVKFYLTSKNNIIYNGIRVRLDTIDSYERWSGKLYKGHTVLSEEEWDELSHEIVFDQFNTEQAISCRIYCPGNVNSNIYYPFSLIVENA